jgi:hypothetical protein
MRGHGAVVFRAESRAQASGGAAAPAQDHGKAHPYQENQDNGGGDKESGVREF